jgi:hypothetical protein
LDPLVKKRFHLAWDVDRVPNCFHKRFVSLLTAFVKKSASPVIAR